MLRTIEDHAIELLALALMHIHDMYAVKLISA